MINESDYAISMSEFEASYYENEARKNAAANNLPIGYIRKYNPNNPHDTEHGWFFSRMFGFFDSDGRLLMCRFGKHNLISCARRRMYVIKSLN